MLKSPTLALLLSILLPWQALFAAPSQRLLSALEAVESNGRVHAVGDRGRAAGCLQIHRCVVDDVNRRYGRGFAYSDRFDPILAREMCRLYLVMHGGHRATDEVYARIWNGGPNGHRKPQTRRYWARVRSLLMGNPS